MTDDVATHQDTPRREATTSILSPGRNCWRIVDAQRVAVIVDADAYFHAAHDALRAARASALLVAWDFDSRIAFPDPKDGVPLGRFLKRLVRTQRELQIRILDWNLGAVRMFARGSMAFSLPLLLLRRHITLKLDGAHAVGASHHQKLAVIDEALAFCGGIDITSERWDTRAHDDDDPKRRRPDGKPYAPWHDSTLAISGDAARALGDLARERWRRATGDTLQPAATSPDPSHDPSPDPWPEWLIADFVNVPVAIARTQAAHEDAEEVRENEALFVDLIMSARRFIYVENQYFASRVIADAIIARLREPDPPEIVVVMPKSADGWLESLAMDSARAHVLQRIANDDAGRKLRVYTPITAGGADIYVHAKIMIVDDDVLRVGSANMNNRSLGLDTECDIAIDARLCLDHDIRPAIRRVRAGLLAEHLGCSPDHIDELLARAGSLIAVVEGLRGAGRTLVPFTPEQPTAAEAAVADSDLLNPGADDAPAYESIANGLARRRTRS